MAQKQNSLPPQDVPQLVCSLTVRDIIVPLWLTWKPLFLSPQPCKPNADRRPILDRPLPHLPAPSSLASLLPLLIPPTSITPSLLNTPIEFCGCIPNSWSHCRILPRSSSPDGCTACSPPSDLLRETLSPFLLPLQTPAPKARFYHITMIYLPFIALVIICNTRLSIRVCPCLSVILVSTIGTETCPSSPPLWPLG